MKKKGKVFILSGPSGSGKTTLYKKLLKSFKLKKKLIKTISVTTRPKRLGERHGRDYFFVSLKMFQHMKRNGRFLESQKVFDNYYGTPRKNAEDLLRKGKNVLLCIDVKGAKVIRRTFPGAVSIFVKTPSLGVLKKRLKNRGSELKDILALRLKIAKEELKEAKRYKYVVTNKDLQKAIRQLENIILAELKS